MPAVETKALLALVEAVGRYHLRQAQERRGVATVLAPGVLEVPGPAEIVFRPGAADRRPVGIAVQVELDLALAPPAVVVDAPGDVRANVVALSCHPVQQRVDRHGGQGIAAPPLGMEI